MIIWLCSLYLTTTIVHADEKQGAEDKYEAATIADPLIPLDELSLLVKPLTAPELETEADAWMQLLRAKTFETSQAELAVKHKNKAIDKAEHVQEALAATQEILEEVADASEQARDTGSAEAADDARELASEAKEAAAATADVIEEALVSAVEGSEGENIPQGLSNSVVEAAAQLTAKAEATRTTTEQVSLAAGKTADAADSGHTGEAVRLANETLTAVDDAKSSLVETSEVVTTVAQEQTEAIELAEEKRIEETAELVTQLAEKEAENKIVILENVNELKVQRTGLIDRLNVVLDELSNKLGTSPEGNEHELVAPYRLYAAAVSELELDVSDTQALKSTVWGWVTSDVGGLRLLSNMAKFLATVVAFWILGMLLGKITDKALGMTRVTAELTRSVIVRSVRRATYLIGAVAGLSAAGFNVGPILAVVGAAGFVVAFALQNTLSNFASGIMLMIYRPFDVGDIIEVSGIKGVARSMNLVSTTISTLDNQLLVVPNNSIWGNIITNITGSDTRRVDMLFGIDYDDDLDEALRILREIVTEHPLVLDDPEPVVEVRELGEYTVNIICWPWAKTEDYWSVNRDVTRSCKDRFDAAGFINPYPRRIIQVMGDAAPTAASAT
jgi:small conductance mechanosensitive channel